MSGTSPNGQLCMRMVLGAAGPVVELQAQSLRLASSGDLRVDCERLELNAREHVTIRSANLTEIVDKDIQLQAGGLIQSEAHAQRHRARMGNIEFAANDDVALDGEQIRLNCPKPTLPTATWPGLAPLPQSPQAAVGPAGGAPKSENDSAGES